MRLIILVSLAIVQVESVRLRVINNGTLSEANITFFTDIDSPDECICKMLTSTSTIVGFNYFHSNHSCQYFTNNLSTSNIRICQQCSLVYRDVWNEPDSTSNLPENELSTESFESTSTVFLPSPQAFWSFDGNYNDMYGMYNGIGTNNVSFCSTGINGYGSSLCFNSALNQAVIINSTQPLNMSWSSMTVELWLYAYSVPSGVDDRVTMVVQCSARQTNLCLFIALRGNKTHFTFYNNFCTGNTSIQINRWYHLGFVYDYASGTQMNYVDGMLVCVTVNTVPLQIPNSPPLKFGFDAVLNRPSIDGRIDHVSLVKWAKTAREILRDATLVANFSFNQNSFYDSGPNRIVGINRNLHLINQTLYFNGSLSFFQASGFVLLSDKNRSYSFSLWLNPNDTSGSTILHLSRYSNGTGNGCITLIGRNSYGHLIILAPKPEGYLTMSHSGLSSNVWTHIGVTYSVTNGLTLYVNGTQQASSGSFEHVGYSYYPFLTLGSPVESSATDCDTGSIQSGQYQGFIDDFQVYSRELSFTDITDLWLRQY